MLTIEDLLSSKEAIEVSIVMPHSDVNKRALQTYATLIS